MVQYKEKETSEEASVRSSVYTRKLYPRIMVRKARSPYVRCKPFSAPYCLR